MSHPRMKITGTPFICHWKKIDSGWNIEFDPINDLKKLHIRFLKFFLNAVRCLLKIRIKLFFKQFYNFNKFFLIKKKALKFANRLISKRTPCASQPKMLSALRFSTIRKLHWIPDSVWQQHESLAGSVTARRAVSRGQKIQFASLQKNAKIWENR